MVGDNLIHDKIYIKEKEKNANYNGYDFKPMYENIKKIVSNYDIIITTKKQYLVEVILA